MRTSEREAIAVPALFAALQRFPGLQRKECEYNQSGADRGMEAVLIQRSTRELATYALVRLRLEAMPELRTTSSDADWTPSEVQGLLCWAQTQGAGGTMLAKTVTEEREQPTLNCRVLAALATLRFYHRREDQNPIVKVPWSEDGFERLAALDVNGLLEYPAQGTFWKRKFQTVQRLVAHVRGKDSLRVLDDEAVVQSLRSIPGVGEQTASMVALFWLGRAVPIIDTYLLRLLSDHHLLPTPFPMSSSNHTHLRRHLRQGAFAIEARHPEWPAARVLSCLYLWACEIGRFRYCKCATGASPSCPIRSTC